MSSTSEMPCFLFEASLTYVFFVFLHQIDYSILSAAIRWSYLCVSGFSEYLRHKEEREYMKYVTKIAISCRFTETHGGKRDSPALYIAECSSVKEKTEVRLTMASLFLSMHIQRPTSFHFCLMYCMHNLAELPDEALSPHYIWQKPISEHLRDSTRTHCQTGSYIAVMEKLGLHSYCMLSNVSVSVNNNFMEWGLG